MRQAIERARVRGEVLNDLDVELLLDMLTGPFYFRTLFGHASMSFEHTGQIVDHVLHLLIRDHATGADVDQPMALRSGGRRGPFSP
jgi:hypothetical protein